MGTPHSPNQLRSFRWFGTDDMRGFGHRSRMRQLGHDPALIIGKPVIAVINTWSEINPCHGHLRERAEAVKRGVWQAGGFPVEIPAFSITETYYKPSPMLYRNLLAMETEEILRGLPVDGAILMGGCDKTIPGLVMGAVSANLPCIFLPAGPMLRGNWEGQPLGSGTDLWKYWTERCAGTITADEFVAIEDGIARSPGVCMTMGTASTMSSVVEALGLSLPGASSIPAPDSHHVRMSVECGRRVVDMVWEQLTPRKLLTSKSFENGIAVDMAIGGSTNAIIHLAALARRCGLEFDLRQVDRISREVPVLANIRPSGAWLMEDFYYAGGLRALMESMGNLLHRDAMTVTGQSIGASVAGARVVNADVIRPMSNPLSSEGGTAILYGSMAPDGAVIKTSAASPNLLRHTGPAVVFRNYRDMEQRIHREDLHADENSVFILQNAGPLGGPGMPEWGMLPIPKKLLARGVRDIVRISDARMSGTSYGTCVLHVSPESFVGGPMALVRDGDPVSLDAPARRLDLLVDESELERRRAAWSRPPFPYRRGYVALYGERVTQAHEGCDFDFLAGCEDLPEPEIH